MQSEQIISWMLIGCVIFIVFVIFSGSLKRLAKLCIRSAIGTCAIFITNFFLKGVGAFVGINAFTAIITGVLGLPGFICLYIIGIILENVIQ